MTFIKILMQIHFSRQNVLCQYMSPCQKIVSILLLSFSKNFQANSIFKVTLSTFENCHFKCASNDASLELNFSVHCVQSGQKLMK